jgi:hypothetical protein
VSHHSGFGKSTSHPLLCITGLNPVKTGAGRFPYPAGWIRSFKILLIHPADRAEPQ